MTETLEATVDKFTFKVARGVSYNSEGVWAKEERRLIRIGLSDFLQQRSGDVAFAKVKPADETVAFGEEVAVIETIKVEAFTRLDFRPVIRIAAHGEDPKVVEARARRALAVAQKYSLVANSIKSEICIEPQIEIV